jgi:hypothetical protein
MSGDDPDFLEFFAGEFWPLRRVGFLLALALSRPYGTSVVASGSRS